MPSKLRRNLAPLAADGRPWLKSDCRHARHGPAAATDILRNRTLYTGAFLRSRTEIRTRKRILVYTAS
eukprot:7696863-Pyramimonas_sp.AAC.1